MRRKYFFNKQEEKNIRNRAGGLGLFGICCLFIGAIFIISYIACSIVTTDISKNTDILGIGIIITVTGFIFWIIGVNKKKNEEEMRILALKNERLKQETALKEIQKIEAEQNRRNEEEKKKLEQERINKFLKSEIVNTDNMTGVEFEDFLAQLFQKLGYKTEKTKASGDYGVDLIITDRCGSVIIQAKRYRDKVSIGAVQEICAARQYYGIYNAWIVSNSYFTNAAATLAERNGVELINRERLSELILQANQRWEQFLKDNSDLHINEEQYSSYITQIEKEENGFNSKCYQITEQIIYASNALDVQLTRKYLKALFDVNVSNKNQFIAYHFALIRIVSFIYRLRDVEPDFVNDILDLCDKDIEILKNDIICLKRASVPTLTKKAIILEKKGRLKEVVELCDFAIERELYEENGSTFFIRKHRLEKKYKL